ncbi:MAG: leucine-rich repeat domain-containing protein [Clostridiaceae bacterium]|nr:leucine-rich repeat domain-containing protein [Clostridiaceae bacterium]
MNSNRVDNQNVNPNEKVNSNSPPRPPVLPKSYLNRAQGTPKPPVLKNDGSKQTSEGVKQEVPVREKMETVLPHQNDSDVVISKADEASSVHMASESRKPSYGTYGRHGYKNDAFKALGVVLAIIVVIIGGIGLLFLASQRSNAATVKIIERPNANVTDLDSFKKYKNLEQLHLYNSGIKDISGVKDLTKLRVLRLTQNEIKDISVLKYLTNLEELYLGDNQISDISALEGLTKLKVLHLGKNKIKDVSPLRNLVNLEELELGYNEIEDISPLENLTKLRILKLNDNKIENIEALRNMTEMRFLLLRENGDIKDLTPLIGLHKVEWCSFNPPSLTLEQVQELKDANPDAIYYFYYKGDYIKAHDEFIYDPGPPPDPGER